MDAIYYKIELIAQLIVTVSLKGVDLMVVASENARSLIQISHAMSYELWFNQVGFWIDHSHSL